VVSEDLKMTVAQNCPGYHPRYLYSQMFSGMSLGSTTESCSNCVHYIRRKCEKDLFDEIKEKIQLH